MEEGKEILLKIWNAIPELVMTYGPKLLGAVAVLVIGMWLVKKIDQYLHKIFKKSGVPDDFIPFFCSVISVTLKIVVVLVAAGFLGFHASSLVAVIAAAGFAVGMALQGSLSNFAAGIMILIFKPYKIGDIVEIHGQKGRVTEIQIFNTIVTNFDNNSAIIPNGLAIDDVMVNHSDKGYERIDLTMYMPYDEDFDRVESIIKDALKSIPEVIQEPEPFVGIAAWESHNIRLDVMPYAHPDHFWTVYYESYRKTKKAMADAGIKFAYSEGVELGPIG